MAINPDHPSAWDAKLTLSVRNLAALKSAVTDPRISKAGRAKIAKALAKMQAADRYRRNLLKR